MGTFVLMNKFKVAKLHALNYHPTKFGDNCNTQC